MDPTPTLPLELILLIAGALPPAALSVLSRTCKSLHHLLSPLLTAQFNKEAMEIKMYAIRSNNGPLLARAIAAAGPDAPPRFTSDVSDAVEHGADGALRVLLEHGAPVPEYPSDVRISLIRDNRGVVEVLLEAGAPGGHWHVYPGMCEWRREMVKRFGGDVGEDGRVLVGPPVDEELEFSCYC